MRVCFRADASRRIGTGHVSRCLTLGERLREAGDQVSFVSRTHPGHLHAAIRAAGFELRELDAPGRPAPAGGGRTDYALWLGASEAADADETAALLEDTPPADWLVVDHYALGRRWESRLRGRCRHLAVIDDLADREHEADLLIDPLPGRDPDEYRPLLPPDCRLLLGPAYAPLRPEFARLRRTGRQPGPPRLLINLGGADPDGATAMALAGLAGADLPGDLRIEVILGASAGDPGPIRRAARGLPWPTTIATGVNDLAARMQAATLAIGAAGMTAWERCCLGLPAVIITIAANQRRIAMALEQAGAIHWLGDLESVAQDPAAVGTAVAGLFRDRPRLEAMAAAAAEVTDGLGADRITAALHEREHR